MFQQKILQYLESTLGLMLKTILDAELNKLIVNFISTVATGNKKIKNYITVMLKEDIQIVWSHDELDYLNAIVIPLLHSKDIVLVTIFVRDREQDKVEYRQIYYKPKDISFEQKNYILIEHPIKITRRYTDENIQGIFQQYHDFYDKMI